MCLVSLKLAPLVNDSEDSANVQLDAGGSSQYLVFIFSLPLSCIKIRTSVELFISANVPSVKLVVRMAERNWDAIVKRTLRTISAYTKNDRVFLGLERTVGNKLLGAILTALMME